MRVAFIEGQAQPPPSIFRVVWRRNSDERRGWIAVARSTTMGDFLASAGPPRGPAPPSTSPRGERSASITASAVGGSSTLATKESLVLSHAGNRGYRRWSFVLASWAVKRQLMIAWASLRSCSRARTSRQRLSSSGCRCPRQRREMTLNSISAIFSQLPCLGVW